jgi:hypothetical protein
VPKHSERSRAKLESFGHLLPTRCRASGSNQSISCVVSAGSQYQQYTVSLDKLLSHVFRQSTTSEPDVSALLKHGRESIYTRDWLLSMKDHAAILSACLAVMHPDMYKASRETMLQLGRWTEDKEQGDMKAILPIWPSIFSVVSVMVNRMSPLHTNINGRPQLFDFLLTVGDYSELDMVIPTVSRRFRYTPGTAIAFSGRLLQHGVRQIADDRAVLSFYMRDNVHEFVDVARSNFMEYSKVGRSCI